MAHAELVRVTAVALGAIYLAVGIPGTMRLEE
jgi:hypothetical protein